MNRPSRQAVAKLRHRLYGILEHRPIGDRLGRIAGQLVDGPGSARHAD